MSQSNRGLVRSAKFFWESFAKFFWESFAKFFIWARILSWNYSSFWRDLFNKAQKIMDCGFEYLFSLMWKHQSLI